MEVDFLDPLNATAVTLSQCNIVPIKTTVLVPDSNSQCSVSVTQSRIGFIVTLEIAGITVAGTTNTVSLRGMPFPLCTPSDSSTRNIIEVSVLGTKQFGLATLFNDEEGGIQLVIASRSDINPPTFPPGTSYIYPFVISYHFAVVL